VSLFGGGASTNPATTKPPFKPVDIPSTAAAAEQANLLGYNLSDADLMARFPGLVSMRDAEINDASAQITGPLDPAVEHQFASTAVTGAQSAFGGGQGTIGEKGSAARGATAAGIANQTQTKQDYDWLTLMNLINANPERQLGLTGGDLLNLGLGNIVGQNQANFAGYQAAVNNANANQQSATQEASGIASTVVSIIGIAL
jgi:hypothetical protein